MVESQVRAGGVFDRRLLAAMGQVPRERFVPDIRRGLAYIDDLHVLDAPSGRFLANPAAFARLVQLAEVKEDDRVLDVGAGTGYSAAVLAALAREVTGLETEARLAELARQNLTSLAVANATIVQGDAAALGEAQFDVMLIEGTVDVVPEALLAKLAPNGRLVALVRHNGVGLATLVRHTGVGLETQTSFNATLPALDPNRSTDVFVF